MSSLAITSRTSDGVLCVAVCGDVDMANSDQLAAATREAAAAGGVDTIVVDLGQVTFMDSNGIRVLVLEWMHAGEHGIRFQVANPSEPVRRVLELTGVLPMLTSGSRS